MEKMYRDIHFFPYRTALGRPLTLEVYRGLFAMFLFVMCVFKAYVLCFCVNMCVKIVF